MKTPSHSRAVRLSSLSSKIIDKMALPVNRRTLAFLPKWSCGVDRPRFASPPGRRAAGNAAGDGIYAQYIGKSATMVFATRPASRAGMMAITGNNSQQEVLNQLMDRKSGATLDELVAAVGLSRTAVNQHLMVLERDGYVRKAATRKTGGRPLNVYILTEDGTNLFPKQY